MELPANVIDSLSPLMKAKLALRIHHDRNPGSCDDIDLEHIDRGDKPSLIVCNNCTVNGKRYVIWSENEGLM